MIKQKNFLIITLFIVLFVSFAGVASARRTEVDYPDIPGIIKPVEMTTLLPTYVKYAFSLAIIISAIIAFVLLVYGGIKWLTSAGSPGAINDAKDRIKAGALGLIVLLSAYTILNTINPQLVTINPGTDVKWGITLYSDSGCTDTKAEITRNTTNLSGFDAWYLKFDDQIPWYSLDVKINGSITMPRNNYETENPDSCRSIGTKADSVDFVWKLPGAYLKRDDGIENFVPNNTASVGDFNDRVVQVQLKDIGGVGNNYGAVLHEDVNWKGTCQVFQGDKGFITSYDLPGTNINTKTSSVTTFIRADSPGFGGVTFYQNDNFGGGNFDAAVSADKSSACNNVDANKNDWATSMKINGSYMAVLFENNNCTGKCQVFTSSDSNFRDDEIGRCGCGPFGNCSDCLSSYIVIPVKEK